MKFSIHSLFMSAVFSLSLNVFAEELNKVDSEALEKTVQLLNDRAQRAEVIENSDGARKANSMAEGLLGEGANLDGIYKVAGEIFRKVATEANGNSTEMAEALQKAQKNPEDFFNKLTDEQKEMVRKISLKVKDRKANAPR